MFADPLALLLEACNVKTAMVLSMADRPPAIDVLYPETAPSISTGSGTQPRLPRISNSSQCRARLWRPRSCGKSSGASFREDRREGRRMQ